MRLRLLQILNGDLGVTAIEYAMIGALISIAIAVGSAEVGTSISGFFGQIAAAF